VRGCRIWLRDADSHLSARWSKSFRAHASQAAAELRPTAQMQEQISDKMGSKECRTKGNLTIYNRSNASAVSVNCRARRAFHLVRPQRICRLVAAKAPIGGWRIDRGRFGAFPKMLPTLCSFSSWSTPTPTFSIINNTFRTSQKKRHDVSASPTRACLADGENIPSLV
jgi:hypothetical protein